MNLILSAREAVKLRKRQERRTLNTLVGPSTLWLILFFLVPLGIMLVISFLSRGTYGGVVATPTINNYTKLLDPDYFTIFQRSVSLAVITTVACLLIGYPMAYFIARRSARMRSLMVLLIIIPFWTNFLVRTYAWMELLRDQGVINNVLM